MILTKVTLTIEDREFDIRHFNYHFCRDTDAKGRPSSRYYGGIFFIEMESLPENYLMSRLVSFEQMLVSGKIEVWANDGEQCIRRIEFEKAYICHHQEEMNRYQPLPMLTTISISPLRLDINKKVRIDRRLPETQGFWTKYVPPKEEKQQQEQEVIYVKKVEGKSQAGVGDKVKYRVTQYTQEGITEDDKKDIKWTISVEGKRTNLTDKGEVITLTIKPEWAGKEIIVMPYLHSSTEKVSVKTKVEKYLVICTDSGRDLFYLDGSSQNLYGKKTVKEAYYKLKIQWFEPTADKYLPLIKIVNNINSFPELKHFSWEQIAEFSEKDRFMFLYRSKGAGDWKFVKEGASGFILVSVDGIPYWADAIGQIPFAVDYYNDELTKGIGAEQAKLNTIVKAKQYGDGQLFGGNIDNTNSYDNAMIKRAVNWASERYKTEDSQTYGGEYYLRVIKTNYSPKNLSIASNGAKIQ